MAENHLDDGCDELGIALDDLNLQKDGNEESKKPLKVEQDKQSHQASDDSYELMRAEGDIDIDDILGVHIPDEDEIEDYCRKPIDFSVGGKPNKIASVVIHRGKV